MSRRKGETMARFGRFLAAAFCVAVLAQSSQAGFSIGGKMWAVMFDESTGADDAVVLGPKAEWDYDMFWVSGMFLVGEAKASNGSDQSLDMQDAEIVAGVSFRFVDFGVGIRSTTWQSLTAGTYGYERGETTIWGPMLYIGAGDKIGNLPLGWYAGASYMFLDMGDLSDAQDRIEDAGWDADVTGEHYNIEAGVSYSYKKFSATLGYRYKAFRNWTGGYKYVDYTYYPVPDWTQQGIALSASYNF